VLTSYATSASPNVHTITLPEQGAYLISLAAWESNRNQMGWITAHSVWAPGATAGQLLMKTNMVGTPALLGEVTNLTVSDPDASGNLTVTLTSAHATNTQSNLRAICYQLIGPNDWGF
jgi:hypothetical protein